jgi:DNA primase
LVPREVIEEIRERTDIVEVVSQVVTLRRKGSSLMGLCPFHQEKSPSFSVVPSKGIYHCFGCQEGGDVFAFLQKTRGLSFFEAVKELGEAAGLQVEERELSREERQRMRARASLHEVLALAVDWFHAGLVARPSGREALQYLKDRGMDRETIEKWRLGFAPDSWDGLLTHLHNQGVSADQAIQAGLARPSRTRRGSAYDLFRGRVIVPIEDSRGRTVAFGGRILPRYDEDGTPKYVNSPETPVYRKSHVLFGLPRARSAIQRKSRALIVEGYFDVISLHQVGFHETIATCGTALTVAHLKALRPLTRAVVALFDADEAGQRAAERSLPLFVDAGIEARRLEIGEAKDPDEFVQEAGADALESALDRSEPLLDLVLRRAIAQYGSTPGARRDSLARVAPILRRMDGPSRRAAVSLVARRLHLLEHEVDEAAGSGPSRNESVARPAAWRGSKHLNHILWLLIHFPETVIPVLVAPTVDPTRLTRHPGALQTIGRLVSGESLASVQADLEDPDLQRVLRVAAARSDLYTEEAAAGAARQILTRLEVDASRAQIAEIDRALSSCDPGRDWPEYARLLETKKEALAAKKLLERQLRSG